MEAGMNKFDLIVIGAGPGGSAAAILAARSGARVLLLERGTFPRHKVCGEFVSAESLDLLSNLLGSAAKALVIPAIRIDRTRLFLDGQVVESAIEPAAASIARFELDAALWQAAASSGVAARDRVTVSRMAREGGFRVSSSSGDFAARAVVDASGRWSNLSSREPAAGPKWLGMKAHFRETNPSPSVDLYFFDGGYCGVQPVNLADDDNSGHRINACAMVRADRATEFSQIFYLHPELKERSRGWAPLMDTVSTSPLIFRKPTPVRDGLFLVGDAAGFVDPFAGDGISLALRSGALAAECLTGVSSSSIASALDTYADRYEAELGPIFGASSTLRRMLALPAAIRRPALVFLNSSPALKRYMVSKTRRAS
jgi:flavin-dependent dehydrogenase